jgi:hypothetical protein
MRYSRPWPSSPLPLAVAALLIVGGCIFLQPTEPARAAGSQEKAARVASREAERSPFFGEWELDLTRMPDTYGPPPKRVTYTFQDVGSGEWMTKVEITAPDGSVRQAVARYRRDGRSVQSGGDMADADSAAFIAPTPNVLVMSLAKNKASAGVRVYTISDDGKGMTESAANIDAQGAPFVRNFYFRRIR